MATPYNILGGRFQPLHIGHMSLLAHAAECLRGHLVIGIVNPDPDHVWPGDGQDWIRFQKEHNPLNYWERARIIQLAVKASGLSDKVEMIVPLPRPSVNMQRARQFIPPKPRQFVLCKKWNDEVENWKRKTYTDNEEEVHIISQDALPIVSQVVEGDLIRSLIATNRNSWHALVPSSTVNYLGEIQFSNRVKKSLTPQAGQEYLDQYAVTHPLSDLALHMLGPFSDATAAPSGRVRENGNPIQTGLNNEIDQIFRSFTKPLKNTEFEIVVILPKKLSDIVMATAHKMYKRNEITTIPAQKKILENLYQVEIEKNSWNAIRSHLISMRG